MSNKIKSDLCEKERREETTSEREKKKESGVREGGETCRNLVDDDPARFSIGRNIKINNISSLRYIVIITETGRCRCVMGFRIVAAV